MENLTKQELLFLTIKSLDVLNYKEIDLKSYLISKKIKAEFFLKKENSKNFQLIKKKLILEKILEKNKINIENQIKLYIICLDEINKNSNTEKLLEINEIKSENYYSFFQFFNKFTYYTYKKSNKIKKDFEVDKLLKYIEGNQINSLNKTNRTNLVYEGLYLVLNFLDDYKKTLKKHYD